MTLSWFDQSQIVFGLIALKKIRHHSVLPKNLYPPFDTPVAYMHENPEWEVEDLHLKFQSNEWEIAMNAARSLNGTATSVNWARDLEKMRIMWETGAKLTKTGDKLQKGEDVEVLSIVSDLKMMSVTEEIGLHVASEVDLTDVVSLQKCGWKEIDETFGGIPASGPLVVYATTKTGKSFWISKLINEFLHYYPEKRATVFSLEMPYKRYLKRSYDMYPTLEEVSDRLLVTSRASNMKEVIAITSTEPTDLVVIDGIADAVSGEKSASLMDSAWSDVKRMGRLLEIPIVAVAQPNRASKFNSQEQFIGKYDIEWSGAAENAAEMTIALQYLGVDASIEKKIFPVVNDAYYMINYFMRDGENTGAVILDKHVQTPLGRRLWESSAHGITKNGEIIPTLYKEGLYKAEGSNSSSRAKR
jgi:replicative DNA helicase